MGRKEWNTNDMGLCTAEWFGIVLFGKELLTCALIQPILAESLCCARTVGASDANKAVLIHTPRSTGGELVRDRQ